uniref:CX domain-containing protein n=2 Tax=Parascaris univalens TaxID=6257 RepID=A0A915C945_PARUN
MNNSERIRAFIVLIPLLQCPSCIWLRNQTFWLLLIERCIQYFHQDHHSNIRVRETSRPVMEILIQPESRGIHYEGYENEYIQCVFEDGDVSGRNERYEFRCRPDLECCGRICCIPQEATVPFWLMILFIVLALLLLFALLGTIAWLCSKRKPKPKLPRPQKTPVYRHDIRGGVGASGYRSIRQQDGDELQSHRDRLHMESAYNTPADNVSIEAQRRGYGNPMYGTREKFVPSPMEEQLLKTPEPHKVEEHCEDEISAPSQPETVETPPAQPQRAQIAYYRSQTDQVASYNPVE